MCKFEEIVHSYDLSEKLFKIIIDSGANIKKACNDQNLEIYNPVLIDPHEPLVEESEESWRWTW
jgi:hypothetical protein